MRMLIRGFDRFLRLAEGVFEFCNDVNCLFRLRLTHSVHVLPLPGGKVPAGVPVLELHFWNEHIPRIPPDGPDFTWARQLSRMVIVSLQAVARYMQQDARLAGVRAVGGITVLLPIGSPAGGEKLMRRLGFIILPYHHPLGRFGGFWENLYTWALMWTFNAVSLRQRQLLRLHRTEVWMSAEEFQRRYGGEQGGSGE